MGQKRHAMWWCAAAKRIRAVILTKQIRQLKSHNWSLRFSVALANLQGGSMQREISFYSERYGRHVSGVWSVFGGRITVTAPDGRQQTTQLGNSTPETLARLMLIEIEGERRHS